MFLSRKEKKYVHFLSILSPVKYEDEFIIEFIEYHKLLGVNHFYFYDNDNEIPLKVTLKDYLDVCTIIEMPGDYSQTRGYKHFCENFKNETKWVAVIDIDEFLVPIKHDNLVDYLHSMEKYDAIAINWMIFGNGPHVKKPVGLVTENYQYCEGRQHDYFKCITKTEAISYLEHPHRPYLKWFRQLVNAKGNWVKDVTNSEYCHDIIQLNHYFTKSEVEYMIKLTRKTADSTDTRLDNKDKLKWIFDEHTRTSKELNTLLWDKYGNKLKNKIDSKTQTYS